MSLKPSVGFRMQIPGPAPWDSALGVGDVLGDCEAFSLCHSVYARVGLCHLSAGQLSPASLPSLFCSPNTICLAPWSVPSFLPSSSSLQSEAQLRERLLLEPPVPSLPLLTPGPKCVPTASRQDDRHRPSWCRRDRIPGLRFPRAWYSARHSYLFVGLSIYFSPIQLNAMQLDSVRH